MKSKDSTINNSFNSFTDEKEYNYYLCHKFHFLLPIDYVETNDKLYIDIDYNYGYTWLDYVEEGWKIIFLEMCEKIQEVLNRTDLNFRIIDIKEKFGEMRVYCVDSNNEIDGIIQDYSEMSRVICINCGAPAKYLTSSWVRPYCANCIPENIIKEELVEI